MARMTDHEIMYTFVVEPRHRMTPYTPKRVDTPTRRARILALLHERRPSGEWVSLDDLYPAIWSEPDDYPHADDTLRKDMLDLDAVVASEGLTIARKRGTGFCLHAIGEEVSTPVDRLLTRLARSLGEWIGIDELADAIWPTETDRPDRWRSNLRLVVSQSRETIRGDGSREIETAIGRGYRLVRVDGSYL